MNAPWKSRRRWASFPPQAWGLDVLPGGRLALQGRSLEGIAERYGTPTHVLDVDRLRENARRAIRAVSEVCGARGRVHYAMKANGTPAVLSLLRAEGLCVEVMTPYELRLARELGYPGADIVVNGPAKTRAFLLECLEAGVRAVVVDSLPELLRIEAISRERGEPAPLLLRVNPDFTPRHVNQGAATASRGGSPFGLDLRGGEVHHALCAIRGSTHLRFLGYHLHVGTGLRHADEHGRALGLLGPLLRDTARMGLTVRILDVGGGYGVPTTRELTTMEMLISQAFRRLPAHGQAMAAAPFEAFVRHIRAAVHTLFGEEGPSLIFEPGRSIVSDAQLLLISVLYVKQRGRRTRWLITDGGLGTVSMPTWYEYHEVFPCGRVDRRADCRTHIMGPGCFAADTVYRNKPLPPVTEGEVLAVMDSGAYFLALESNFSHPRSAIVGVESGEVTVLRRRETCSDMTMRDTAYVTGGVR